MSASSRAPEAARSAATPWRVVATAAERQAERVGEPAVKELVARQVFT